MRMIDYRETVAELTQSSDNHARAAASLERQGGHAQLRRAAQYRQTVRLLDSERARVLAAAHAGQVAGAYRWPYGQAGRAV